MAIPALSRLQSEPERFRAFYRRGLEVVIFLLCPFMLVAMAAADHLVLLFLGPQWTESIPIFLALTPAGLVACTGVATSWVYIPLGRTDRQFHWRIVSSIVTIGSVLVGLQWGTLGVAVAFSAQAVAMRVPAIAYCLHGISSAVPTSRMRSGGSLWPRFRPFWSDAGVPVRSRGTPRTSSLLDHRGVDIRHLPAGLRRHAGRLRAPSSHR